MLNETPAMLIFPNLSDKMPPRHLPNAAAQANITLQIPALFHGKSSTRPVYDRIHTTSNKQTAAISKCGDNPPSSEKGAFFSYV